jgi:hypothetical protein
MKKYIFLSFIIIALLTSCSPMATLTKEGAFPRMYQETPLSVVVAPPINEVTAADAAEFYLSTIADPFTMHGYYIFPIPLINQVLKDEGVFNTLQELPPADVAKKMYALFGADATLFSRIQKWDKKYRVVAGSVTVLIDYQLISGKTGEILWSHAKEVVIDTSGSSNNGLLANLIETAITTAVTDFVPIARQANSLALIAFPYGKYNPLFLKDNQIKVQVFKSKVDATGGTVEEKKK